MNNTEPTNLFYRIINVLSKLITHNKPPNTYVNTYDYDDITNEKGVDDYKLEIAEDYNNLEKKEKSTEVVDNHEIELENEVVNNHEIELENEVVDNHEIELENEIVDNQEIEVENEIVDNQEIELENEVVDNQEIELENEVADNQEIELENEVADNQEIELENEVVDNQELELENEVVDNQELELENEVVTNYNDLEFHEDAEIKAILDSVIDKINNDYLNHNTYNGNINKTPVRDNVNCNWFEYYSTGNTQNYNCLECGDNELNFNLSS
jgi:hypothetical protein